MVRLISVSLLLGAVGLSGGCATCCAPFDCYYLAQTGRWVRYNPTSGRVGSAFDNAGGPADAIPVSAEMVTTTPGEPMPAQPQVAPSQPQSVPMQPRMTPGYQSSPPGRMSPTAPQTRSVIPRNMGETYLPRGN